MADTRSEVTSARVYWAVDHTNSPPLAPVRVSGHAKGSGFSVQDYLTPDEARSLAARLVATANAVEAAASLRFANALAAHNSEQEGSRVPA